jgi:hypothetical protein
MERSLPAAGRGGRILEDGFHIMIMILIEPTKLLWLLGTLQSWSTRMDIKYIGMDIHKEAISIAVMNGDGKLVMESIIEAKASTILQFIQGLRGDLHVTFEEGTWAAWLYDLLKPHVTKLVVCDPRKKC